MARTFLFPACFSPLWLLVLAPGCGSTSSSGGDFDCPGGLVAVQNQEFCAGHAVTTDCNLLTPAYRNQLCGVALKPPPGALLRSDSVTKYAGSGPPSVSCMSPAGYPAPAGVSQNVTVNGIVEIFSHGCESKNVTIEFHRVTRTGEMDDGKLGPTVGTPVTTCPKCEKWDPIQQDDPDWNCTKADETDWGNKCVQTQTDTCAVRYEYTYRYTGVPTETELAIKTSGALWAPLLEYNIYIPNDEVVDGVWTRNVRSIAKDDYTLIAQTAIGMPITSLHGMIMGEVHDCEDVRLVNAVVDIDAAKKSLLYFTVDFNGNEALPLPDFSAKGTSALGMYAAMDIKPGPVTVAAAGLVGEEVVALGFYRAWVYEDSITSVTFRGLRPFQLP